MTRDELFRHMVAARPEPASSSTSSGVARSTPGRGRPRRAPAETLSTIGDVWMFYAVQWRLDDPQSWRPFFDDLLEEMESMLTGTQVDRCRWPVDDLWPRRH